VAVCVERAGAAKSICREEDNPVIDVKQKLRRGEPVFMCMMQIHHPAVVEILGHAGFDMVCVDGEHVPLDGPVSTELVRAAECAGTTATFRADLHHPGDILPMLDAGMKGVMVPQVSTREEAEMAVRAVKYAPLGVRGMAPVRAARYGATGMSVKEYMQRANRETLVMLQIEDTEGVENLDSILGVHEADVLVIGTGDLAQSMGYPGETSHPKVVETVDEIIERALSAGKTVGIGASGRSVEEWLARGVSCLVWGDVGLVRSAALGVTGYAQTR
jgi:4-hydroxy-2-oxoheptanedioate aldolase